MPQQQKIDEADQAFLDGLDNIRNGITENNWESVCLGYYAITGERFAPPNPPTQSEGLAALRKLLNYRRRPYIPKQAKKLQRPASTNPIKQPSPKTSKSGGTKKEINETDVDTQEQVVVEVTQIKHRGKGWAKGNIEVIASQPNVEEKRLNKKRASMTDKGVVKRQPDILAPFKGKEDDENAPIRYHDKIKKPAAK